MLPGQRAVAAASAEAGLPLGWKPLALVPELALTSLFDVFVPAAVLLGLTRLDNVQRQRLVVVVIVIGAVSAALAIIQISGPFDSPVYLYRRRALGSADGFFANRNHQGVFLAMQLPLLRAWTLLPAASASVRRFRHAVAGILALVFIPLILMTGSRAGLAATLLGFLAAGLLAPWWQAGRRPARRTLAVGAALAALPIVLAVLTVWLGRALTLDRLRILQEGGGDLRFSNAATTWQIARDFFPFGTGFGAFDRVFRIYEPFAALQRTYYNHAHNDLLEVVITGGLIGALILLGWATWGIARAAAAWRPWATQDPDAIIARAGAAMLVLLCAASLVDYPVRTPLIAGIAALCTGWLAFAPRSAAVADRRALRGDSG
ncbi:O-antigen ligase family protein [Sphingomonas sp. MA1305]|uniref:O-antigen ligase family protein n=1 Tax=Sphingomonas sp. MA1305 TaxID=2479204 RepID=UPI0018DF5B07|nr:O-antigen ligase family protein [Sphingomonas sp. MA1305]